MLPVRFSSGATRTYHEIDVTFLVFSIYLVPLYDVVLCVPNTMWCYVYPTIHGTQYDVVLCVPNNPRWTII